MAESRDNYYIDQDSQALIFPVSKTVKLEEQNNALKSLLSSLLQALPTDIVSQIPEEHLRVVNGN